MRYEQLLHVERVVASYLYTDLTERAFEDVMDHYQAIAREQQEDSRVATAATPRLGERARSEPRPAPPKQGKRKGGR